MTVIVDPDFLNHWRTRMLVEALNDEMAPLYVIRIWGHCQQRRADRFDGMPAAGLKALCKAAGDAQALETALIEAGFIARDGSAITVPKWAEKNASLLAAWDNGNKGGRPKKPKQNPRVPDSPLQDQNNNPDKTHGFDDETQGKPTENPDVTDKSRGSVSKDTGAAAPDPDPIFGAGLAYLVRCGVPEKGGRSFLGKMRKELRDDLVAVELLVKAQQLEVSDPVSWLRAAARNRIADGRTGSSGVSL
jgi:hypothetical protein